MSRFQRHIELLIEAKDLSKRVLNDVLTRQRTWGRRLHSVNLQAAKSYRTVRDAIFSIEGALGGLVGGALAQWIKTSIDAAEAAGQMAERTGWAVEELTTLAPVLQKDGADLKTLETAIAGFGKKIQEAANGTGEGKAAFDSLGISVRGANGEVKSSRELFDEVADAMARHADGAGKTAVAQKLFEESGRALIPTLNKGSEEIRRQQEHMRSLGAEITGDTARDAAEFNALLVDLQTVAKGLGVTIARDTLPGLTAIAEALRDGWIQGGLAESAWRGAQAAWESLTKAGDPVVNAEKQMQDAMTKRLALLREIETLEARREFGSATKSDLEDLRKMNQELSVQTQRWDRFNKIVQNARSTRDFENSDFENLPTLDGFEDDQARPQLRLAPTSGAKPAGGQAAAVDELDLALADAEAALVEYVGMAARTEAMIRERQMEGIAVEAETYAALAVKELEEQEASLARKAAFAERVLLAEQEFGLSKTELLDLQLRRELEMVGENEEARLALKRQYAERRAETERQAHQAELQLQAQAANAMLTIAHVAGVGMFKEAQTVGAAQALVNAFVGASEGLKAPFPHNLIAAAQILSTGKSFVQSIKGASPGGGAGASLPGGAISIGGGGGFGGTAPAPASPIPLPDAGAAAPPTVFAKIDVHGDAVDPDRLAMLLNERLERLARFGQVRRA